MIIMEKLMNTWARGLSGVAFSYREVIEYHGGENFMDETVVGALDVLGRGQQEQGEELGEEQAQAMGLHG